MHSTHTHTHRIPTYLALRPGETIIPPSVAPAPVLLLALAVMLLMMLLLSLLVATLIISAVRGRSAARGGEFGGRGEKRMRA